ncbi:metal-dependent protein hydrolase [Rickenella mellea]|uniref:Metal-dependent protein hydrolase n=1 Tax=Rickenella mellea TaxID=50990 RepID=A0A4Y7Q4J1_9AGAM|nr:metal-dependent protein hydrolase [Rickenella mellea]
MATFDENSQAKRPRLDKGKVIGTHNGTFHCDEALAVFLLKQTAIYHDAAVVRTRQQSVLETCDIVVDVGAVYDEGKQRFDHHQREFSEVFGHGFTTKLSSAGLIYKHFGKEIIANRLQLPSNDSKIDTLWLKIYKEFIESIDGIDNGISQYSTDQPPKYRVKSDLSSRVSFLNPSWNEASDGGKMDVLFRKASELTGNEFVDRLDYYGKAWLPARDLVAKAILERSAVDPSEQIVLFDQFVPWKEHLFELEAEQDIKVSRPIYVIYPDELAGAWRIQAVPISSDSFESRKALPTAWRGLRDESLSEIAGIPGCIFVHSSGFIGGNASKEGAMALARKALTATDGS